MAAVDTVFKRRGLLIAALGVWASRAPTGDELGALAGQLLRLLPEDIPLSAVYRSLAAAAAIHPGRALSQIELRDLAWALAGDTKGLKAGRAVYPPEISAEASDALVQVLACRRLPPGRGEEPDGFRVRYRGRVLAGRGTPAVFEWVWSSKFVSFLARRPDGLGFAPRGKAGRPYQHHSTLVGMRFKASLYREAGRFAATGSGRVRLESIRCPGSLRAFNQALTEMRLRTTFACPFGYSHACHTCPKGQKTPSGDPSCPAACRPTDLETKPCPACQRPDAEFDPAWPSTVCAHCQAKGKSL